ncbi:MAG: hypothetical protein DRP59_01970 [Spirochaetes bacterium]|nr:MAG: hypothetical protein DRP59_01970 [Spirochaetota bacterium]
MKIKITVLLGAVLAVLLIGSCSLFGGLSIEARIAQFVSDLNTSDRANIIENFSADGCDSYNLINDSNYWNDSNSPFDVTYRNFAVTGLTVSGDTATGTLTYNNGSNSSSIKFVLVNDGFIDGWKITEIWIDGTHQI